MKGFISERSLRAYSQMKIRASTIFIWLHTLAELL